MNERKFEVLLCSLNNDDLKLMINDYNTRCVKEGRKEDKMRGYSALSKTKLIDFIITFLSEKEEENLYKIFEPKFMKELISDTLGLLGGKDKREHIEKVEKFDGDNGFRLKIKGFQWEEECKVQVKEGELIRSCTCRIGRLDGICRHEMAGFIMLYGRKKIELKSFPLDLEESWLQPVKKQKDLISSQTKSEDEADIVFADKYKIFVDGPFVTMKWGGPYAGKKTVNTEELGEDVESWVANKVVNKMLKPLKISTKEGTPSLIEFDSYGIIDKILDNEILVKKILKKFKAVSPDLPTDLEGLETYLRKNVKLVSVQ